MFSLFSGSGHNEPQAPSPHRSFIDFHPWKTPFNLFEENIRVFIRAGSRYLYLLLSVIYLRFTARQYFALSSKKIKAFVVSLLRRLAEAKMQKFAFIISVAVGFLCASGVRADADTELTTYNHGEGTPYIVQMEVTLKEGVETSKQIAFNDFDSVSFEKANFVKANVYKQLANTVGEDGKQTISSDAIKLGSGVHQYCYEVTGAFADAKINPITCP